MDPEVWKALLNFVVTVSSLMLTWFIGNRVAMHWAERQKRRELELALANTFYTYYGEFRGVWRLWNQSLEDLSPDSEGWKKTRENLLDRASRAEGGLEASLLKVASERVLTKDEQADLGELRQAFQVLCERIQEGVPVSYGSSKHPDYVEFKRLATRFGTLLASRPARRRPTPKEAFEAFLEITANYHESRWKRAGK